MSLTCSEDAATHLEPRGDASLRPVGVARSRRIAAVPAATKVSPKNVTRRGTADQQQGAILAEGIADFIATNAASRTPRARPVRRSQ